MAAIAPSPFEILVSGSKRANYRTLEAALAGCAAGDRILLGPGTYQAPAGGYQMTKAGVQVIGTAPGRVLVRAALDASVTFHITANDVRLQGFEIDGQGASQTSRAGNNGVEIAGVDANNRVSRVTLDDLYLHGIGNAGHGIHLLWSEQITIRFCRIESHCTNSTTWGGWGALKGIFVERTNRALIDKCYLTGWSQAVGFWNACYQCRLINSVLKDNFGFEGDNQDPPRSAFEDYGNGVTVGTHGDNSVENCVVDGSAAQCLEIAQDLAGGRYINNVLMHPGTPVGRLPANFFGNCAAIQGDPGNGQPTTDILFTNNQCYGNAGVKVAGCTVTDADRVTLTGNHYTGFSDAASVGAVSISRGRGILVRGEQVMDSKFGVFVNLADNPVIIEACCINGTGYTSAIQILSGDGHRVLGNQINVDGRGIHLQTGGAYSLIEANTIQSGDRGLFMNAIGIRAISNRIKTASGIIPVQLDSTGCHQCTVRENTIDGNGTSYISAGALNNRFMENYFVQGVNLDTSGAGAGNTTTGNYT